MNIYTKRPIVSNFPSAKYGVWYLQPHNCSLEARELKTAKGQDKQLEL